jgi:putative hydrolase of the HAD superfamily
MDGGRESMIRAISFDVGQTLLRPFPSFGDVFVRCCSDGGVELSADIPRAVEQLVDRFFDDLRDRQVLYSTSIEQSRAIWTDLYVQILNHCKVDARQVDLLAARLYAAFVDHATYELFDDALPVVQTLKARGFKIGVTSNWESWLTDLLTTKKLADFIEFAAISGGVGFEKPDRRIFDLSVARAGFPASAVLHVGDSVTSDVHGAVAAGLRAILLDRNGAHAGTDVPKVTNLYELLDLPELNAPANELAVDGLGT